MLRLTAVTKDGVETSVITRQLPFSIGRSLGNDLVLDDATVSFVHARVEEIDGAPYLVDAGSTNGIVLNGQRTDRVFLHQGLEVYLGQVQLRFELEGNRKNTVKLEKFDFAPQSCLGGNSFLAKLAVFLFAPVLLILINAMAMVESYSEVDWTKAFYYGLSSSLALLVVTALVALMSKIQCRKYNFAPLFAVTLLVCCLVSLSVFFISPLWGHLPWVALHQTLGVLIGFVALITYAYQVGTIVWPTTKRRKVAGISFFIWAALFAFSLVIEQFADETPPTKSEMRLAYPVNVQLFGTHNVSELDEKLAALETSLMDKSKKLQKSVR